MRPVKRQLVYVAEDSDDLLHSIIDSPERGVRPSRLSRMVINNSPDPQPTGERKSTEEVADDSVMDKNLLVSYHDFLFASGSPKLNEPRSLDEAIALRNALHDCQVFLRSYIRANRNPALCSSSESSSASSTLSVSSGSASDASDISQDDDDDNSDLDSSRGSAAVSPPRKRRRVGGRQGITNAELREQLAKLGLPTSGTKKVLQERLQSYMSPHPSRAGRTSSQRTGSRREDSACSRPSGRASSSETVESNKRCASTSGTTCQSLLTPASGLSGPSTETPSRGASQTPAMTVRHEDEDGGGGGPGCSTLSPSVSNRLSGKGLWGALLSAGNIFFGQGRRSGQGGIGTPVIHKRQRDSI